MGFLGLIWGLFLVWILYRGLRANPQFLSKENLTKSSMTLGLLALVLITFVSIVVMMLK